MTQSPTSRAPAPLAALGVLLLTAVAARADVRVELPGGAEPELAIRLSPAGPWSLVGPLDETVLNPGGDSHGDGLPDDDSQGEHMLAAWVRPGNGRVHLSRWGQEEWRPLTPFEARESIGTPRVDALGTGWAVTWQQAGDVPIIRASGVGFDGTHYDSEPIIHGWLVDETWLEDDVQLVLHHDADRERLFLTGVQWAVPGVPSPVDIVFVTEIESDESGKDDGRPAPSIAPAPKPGRGQGQPERGAWARRAAVTWWDARGQPHQVLVNVDGDSRELIGPRSVFNSSPLGRAGSP